MFDIGFGEMLLLAAIALIALGPKQLPEVARALGRFLNQLKSTTDEFKKSFAESNALINDPIQKAQEKLRESVIPSNFLHDKTSGHAGSQMPQQSNHQPVSPAATSESGSEDSANQMAFDLEKKESKDEK